jgi:hypothetical protein
MSRASFAKARSDGKWRVAAPEFSLEIRIADGRQAPVFHAIDATRNVGVTGLPLVCHFDAGRVLLILCARNVPARTCCDSRSHGRRHPVCLAKIIDADPRGRRVFERLRRAIAAERSQPARLWKRRRPQVFALAARALAARSTLN